MSSAARAWRRRRPRSSISVASASTSIPGTGLLPAVVPGAFDAWCLCSRLGHLGLPDVLAFAIGYARNGIHSSPASAQRSRRAALFEGDWQARRRCSCREDNPGAGHLFARPASPTPMSESVAKPAGRREKHASMPRGVPGRWLHGRSRRPVLPHTDVLDVSGRRHRGLLSGEDLRAGPPRSKSRSLRLSGHTVLKCGPWSRGRCSCSNWLCCAVRLARWTRAGADFVHLVVECAETRLCGSRGVLWRSGFCRVPLGTCYRPNTMRRAARDRRRALAGFAARRIRWFRRWWTTGRAPGSAGASGGRRRADRGAARRDRCRHLPYRCDRPAGNMVSATPSGGWLQSSPVIPELGFCMGTRGQMFWLRDGCRTAWRLASGRAPRCRRALRYAEANRGWRSGTPGGEQQDQWSLIYFLRMVHHGMTIQQAIDTPSFHTEHWPSSFGQGQRGQGSWCWKGGSTMRCSASWPRAGIW